MRTNVVPAQITTVEDKIAANLSFSQLLLLTVPVFLGSAIFVVMPPLFKFTYFKLFVIIAIALLCMTLAIRVRGKIVLQWVVIITRYKVRPQIYFYNKNNSYLRPNENMLQNRLAQEELSVKPMQPIPRSHIIPMHKIVRAEAAIADPRAKFQLRAKKGVLRVYIHEVKEKGI